MQQSTLTLPSVMPAEAADSARVLAAARRALESHSFCTLATVSPAGRPSVAGVSYALAEGALWVHTFETSLKARNLMANPAVAVCVPVKRFPFVPPFVVQMQGRAEVLDLDEPRFRALLEAGRLRKIEIAGAMERPGSKILRITPGRTISTFGIGVPIRTLLRDPLQGSRTVVWSDR